jgi:hypothetical protein
MQLDAHVQHSAMHGRALLCCVVLCCTRQYMAGLCNALQTLHTCLCNATECVALHGLAAAASGNLAVQGRRAHGGNARSAADFLAVLQLPLEGRMCST